MNIFYLDKDPYKAAEYLCDKHVVKMIVESAQMLSTCQWWYKLKDDYPIGWFSVDDIKDAKISDVKGIYFDLKTHKKYISEERKQQYKQKTGLLLPTHINHPCNCWVRESMENYFWLYKHFHSLLNEYYKRYNKTHQYTSLVDTLFNAPNEKDLKSGNIMFAFKKFTEPPLVMPDEYKFRCNDCDYSNDCSPCTEEGLTSLERIQAYRDYYLGEKLHFAKWKLGNKPEWVKEYKERSK